MLGTTILTALLAAIASATPIELFKRQGVTPVPSQDPFYTPTGNWQAAKNGAILNSRPVPGTLSGLNYKSAYQLLYKTTDSVGKPTHAVTTVIVPNNADTSKLLSYQIFYDSADVDCSPSYALINGGLQIDTGVGVALGNGWIVNTPDYEGPTAAFTAGVISGQATLDSIRAALASTSITGVKSNARTAMWGYSGGALASEWAAELAPSYAPELQIAGAAIGGLTPDVKNVALTINGGPYAGFIPAGIVGLATQYKNLSDYVDANLRPEKKAQFYGAKNQCLPGQLATTAGTNYSTYTTLPFNTLFDGPIAISVLNAGGRMGLHGTPKIPLFVYKGAQDEISPVADTDALVKKYCTAGVKIQYQRDLLSNHLSEALTAQNDANNYLKNIMNGGAAPNNCGSSQLGLFGF